MKVYLVLEGDDCEGAYVQAVFRREEDAIQYLDEKYRGWKKTMPTERRSGCTTAFVEEWDVTE